MVSARHREDPVVDPVKALRAWLKAAAISSGPVFRLARGVTVGADGLNSAAVSRVTKEAAERAGLNPSGYSAHSLRAGFVSECDRRHIPNGAVRAVTRHTSDALDPLNGAFRTIQRLQLLELSEVVLGGSAGDKVQEGTSRSEESRTSIRT